MVDPFFRVLTFSFFTPFAGVFLFFARVRQNYYKNALQTLDIIYAFFYNKYRLGLF